MFLGCGFRQAFDIILVLQFVALLISYALAGSEAYAQVIGVNYFYVIPVFVWVLTLAIVFALHLVQPVVSILTFFKGSLLLGTVIVTFYVGAEVHREIKNDFSAVGAPFLMGTVALGGVINTMPLMYSKISPVKNQVKNFRFAVNAGLMTCTILNVLWCWAVLDIVPQLSIHPCSTSSSKNNTYSSSAICISNISLESAAAQGEISTIPLSRVIEEKYPTFTWVAFLVNIFIMVSITVSYLTVGAVLHHTLHGWLTSFWRVKEDSLYNRSKSKQPYCNIQCVCSSVVSLTVFGIVFGIAMLDPKGFVDMLEKFSSFTLNIEAGVFVFLMLLSARKKENLMHKIPVPLPGAFRFLLFTVPLYFCFAVVYDVYVTVAAIIHEQSHKEHFVIATQGALNVTHPTVLYSGAGHTNTQTTEGPINVFNSSFTNFSNVF
ncbi:hypothetical protein FSP39_015594 [Pinctada imbricata]|uniref:Uncharacterized protein n=1 Tax=Pinctada imbricata TaxID=66713 RepID=A0AA89BYS6_PINIB|nr:hypothetical protein FSP39_015594 [Pinctada imbricata]